MHEAFDGRQVPEWTEELQALFHSNRFNSLPGAIGCAVSHYSVRLPTMAVTNACTHVLLQIWQDIATTSDELHLVFEDDTMFLGDFITDWNAYYAENIPVGTDIIYIGGLLTHSRNFSESKYARVNGRFLLLRENISQSEPNELSFGFMFNTNAYVLSSNAARWLLEFVAKHGFVYAVDMMMMHLLSPDHIALVADPLLIAVPNAFKDGGDSNIYNDLSRIPGSPSTWANCRFHHTCDSVFSPPIVYRPQYTVLNRISGVFVLSFSPHNATLGKLIADAHLPTYGIYIFQSIRPHEIIAWTPELAALFGSTSPTHSRAALCHIISHVQLWMFIANSTLDHFLVMSDAIEGVNDLRGQWAETLRNQNVLKYDMLFLANPFTGAVSPSYYYSNGDRVFSLIDEFRVHLAHQLNDTTTQRSSAMDDIFLDVSAAYIVSRKGASLLLQYFHADAVKHSVNHYLAKLFVMRSPTFLSTPLVSYPVASTADDVINNREDW